VAEFFDRLNDDLVAFIDAQPVFFVATAVAGEPINLSPKGMDTLRVLDDRRVAYLDVKGSGNQTATHIGSDGRLTMLLCSFDRRPMILRLYGTGRVVGPSDAQWAELRPAFPEQPGVRHIICLDIESVQTSCGYAVPLMQLVGERDTLRKYHLAREHRAETA
jgi:hypothetical protein